MWLDGFGDVQENGSNSPGPELVLYVFAAVAALNLVLALAVLIVGFCFRTSMPGSSMDMNIVFGGLLLVATVLLRGLQIKWTTDESRMAICQFYPALVTFGLLWFIGGLLMKVSAIFHYYRRHDSKKVERYECLPHMWLLFLMFIDVIIVLIWVLKYIPVLYEDKEYKGERYVCKGPMDPIFQVIVAGLHGILLLFAAIIVWPAVHRALKTPSSYESLLMAVIIYNTLFVSVAAVLLFFFGQTQFKKNELYAMIGGLMNYAVFAAFLFLLIGKVVTARKEQASGEGSDVYDQVENSKGYD